MPPAKRKPKKVETKPKPVIVNKGLCHCRNCYHRGEQIYEMVWKCKVGVNEPYGNHIVNNCYHFKKRKIRKIKNLWKLKNGEIKKKKL